MFRLISNVPFHLTNSAGGGSRGESLGPQLGYAVVLLPVGEELLRDGADERVVRVAVRQQRADGQQHLGHGQRRRPVLLEDVEADGTLRVDVAVVDARPERHLQRRQWHSVECKSCELHTAPSLVLVHTRGGRTVCVSLSSGEMSKKHVRQSLCCRVCVDCSTSHQSPRGFTSACVGVCVQFTLNLTFGGLKGYSLVKCTSRKKTPPSYTDPGGPRIVDTHSYRLSPLGPALQSRNKSSPNPEFWFESNSKTFTMHKRKLLIDRRTPSINLNWTFKWRTSRTSCTVVQHFISDMMSHEENVQVENLCGLGVTWAMSSRAMSAKSMSCQDNVQVETLVHLILTTRIDKVPQAAVFSLSRLRSVEHINKFVGCGRQKILMISNSRNSKQLCFSSQACSDVL